MSKSYRFFPIILIIPAVAIVFFLVIFPLIWALGLSFHKYNVLRGGQPIFVGLDNYVRLISSEVVWGRFTTTITFVVLAVTIEFLLGFGLAFLFFQEFKGRRLAITLVTMPLLIAPVAAGLFFKYIYDATFGVLTYFVKLFTGISINMLRDYAMLAAVLVDAWQWTPFMMLFILAGLEAVPKHLLESAEVDRLRWIDKFRAVIWPTIRPLLMLALLFRTMDAFRTFDSVFILTEGGPGTQTELITIYLYRIAFRYFNTGEACSLAFIVLIIVILLTNLYLRMARRVTE
ncbi:MAG: sugar ABC transporter permease [Candidatus Bathyarchaeia archaeon]